MASDISNADPAPEPDFQPSLSATDWLIQQRRGAIGNALRGLDGDPDQAARAYELGDATNIDPAAIYRDVDNFEKAHKAALVSELVNSSSFIRGLTESHPLAPTLAANDYGNLSDVGDKINDLKGKPTGDYLRGRINPVLDEMTPPADQGYGRTGHLAEAAAAARAKWGPVGEWAQNLITIADPSLWQYNPAIRQGIEDTIKSTGAMFSAAADPNRSALERALAIPSAAATAAGGAMVPMSAMAQIAGDSIERVTGGYITSGQVQAALGVAGIFGHAGEAKVGIAEANKLLDSVQEVGAAVKPYVDAGLTPPLGIHPAIDKMYGDLAAADLRKLNALEQSVGKSSMRETAPAILEGAIDREYPGFIGVKASAVRKLYGDKQITAGDGLLGDAGNVAEQLIMGEAHDGDVEIPLSKWLTRVEPDVQKALKDDVRVRAGMPTANESAEMADRVARAKEAEEQAKAEAEPTQIRPTEQLPSFSEWLKSKGFSEDDPDIDLRQEEYQEFLQHGKAESTKERLSFASAGATRKKSVIPSEEISDPGSKAITDQLDQFMAKGRGNAWVKVPEGGGGMYLRLGRRPEGQTIDIANLDFDQKGTGAFTRYIQTIEDYASEKGIPNVRVENIFNDRLIDFLRRRGYTMEPRIFPDEPPSMFLRPKDPKPIELARRANGEQWRISYDMPTQNLHEPNGIIPVKTNDGSIRLPDGSTTRSLATFTAGEALRQVKVKELPGIAGSMADFLGERLYAMAGDVSVHVVKSSEISAIAQHFGGQPGDQWHAFYAPNMNYIVMDVATANGTRFGHVYTAGVLTEEIAHAATARAIIRNPEIQIKLQALRDYTMEWMRKNNPDLLRKHQYELSNNDEFIAWTYHLGGEFKKTLSQIPISPAAAKIFGTSGRATIWDSFRQMVKDIMKAITGKVVPESVLDGLLRMGPEFEKTNKAIRSLKGEKAPPDASAFSMRPTDVPEDPITQRIKAYGMNKRRADNYRKLVEKSQAEDAEFQLKKGIARERQMQTAEWNANAKQMRVDVETDLKQRPDFLAEKALLGKRLGMTKDGLTPEQIASLPKDYFTGRQLIQPDQLAKNFGYSTGDQLVEALAQLKSAQDVAGLNPKEYFKSVVDVQTKKDMALKYGDLEQNIMADAQEHVLGASSMDITHEELIALAERAGVTMLDKDGIKAAAKAEFDKQTIETISSRKYQDAASRAAQKVEDELAKGESADARKALKSKWEQVNSQYLAGFAKKLERKVASDSRLRDRLAKTEPTGIDPEYAIWAQDILSRTGTFVRRTIQGMARQKDLVSRSKTLREFVDEVNSASNIWQTDPNSVTGFNLPVPDFLMDPSYNKPVGKMTVAEFESVNLAIKAINGIGRDIRSFVVKGEKVAVGDVRDGLISRMTAFFGRELPYGDKSAARWVGMELLSPETWFNKLDLFNPRGPFNQLLVRPVIEGTYEALAIKKEMAADWKALADFKDPTKAVPNPLFRDPSFDENTPGKLRTDMTREQAFVVLANMGNDLQRRKLAGGYGIKDVQDIWNWLGTILTKEDMDRQQKMGQFWAKYFARSEEMYAKLRGWIPDRIELGAVQTPWGIYDEWYHPLIKDPQRHPSNLKVADILDESGYYRPGPPSGYTKQRTGAIYPIDLSFRGVIGRAEQIANDIAMRPPITEVSKIFLDRKFKDAMGRYMGQEYSKAIEPWLRDSAGQRRPLQDSTAEWWSNYVRQNMSTLLIGLNPGTFLKHTPTALIFSAREVGTAAFLDSVAHIFGETATGETRAQFAFKHSQELPNRLHVARESIGAVNDDIFRGMTIPSKFMNLRDFMQTVGAFPVAMGDLASAVPMWDAKYRQLRAEGLEHGDAVYEADRAVRRTHGSTIVANRPAALRAGGPVAWLMPFYNFFNNAANRIYESGWRARLAMSGRDLPEMTGFERETYDKGIKQLGVALSGYITFAVIPSLIEQWVDPLKRDKKETALWYWTKVLNRAPVSMLPITRDLIGSLWEGHDANIGLFGTAAQDVLKPVTTSWKKNPSIYVRGANEALGAATGMTYEELGRLQEFVYGLHKGTEHPKGFMDILHGARHGTLKEPR